MLDIFKEIKVLFGSVTLNTGFVSAVDEDESIAMLIYVRKMEIKRENRGKQRQAEVESIHVSSSKSSTDDDAKTKKRKKPSTSTDEIDEDAIIVPRSEFKEMKKSMKELSEAMKKLQEILLTKTDQLEVSLKEKETPEAKFTCCFDCDEIDAFGNSNTTIFVKGFENLRPRVEIRKDLSDIFSSCGNVTRFFVPIECKSRLPLGFAFIDLKNEEGNDKALELSGSYMGGKELEVTMATKDGEYSAYSNFEGCESCLGSAFMRYHLYDMGKSNEPNPEVYV